MRPPICDYCGRNIRDDENLDFTPFYFQETHGDRERREHMEKTGMVGHPGNCEWYCSDHAPVARKYLHLTLREARKAIAAEIGESA